MARVEIATTGAGWVQVGGQPVAGATVQINNLDGSPATHWSAVTGGSSSTGTFTTDVNGYLRRFIEGGVYDVEINGVPAGQVDFVSGSVATDTAAVTADMAVTKEAPLNVQYPEYGALGNDAADDAAALALAVAALPANGGEILLPPGGYRFSSFPSLAGKRAVLVRGAAGARTGGAVEAVRLIYTGTGPGTAIDAKDSFGVSFEHMVISHDGAFTGTLLDFSRSGAFDTQFPGLRDVTLCGTTSNRGATGLKLVKAVNGCFQEVNFRDLDIGVLGRSVSGDYSTTHRFIACRWGSIVAAPVKNAGESWTFLGPVVQERVDGSAGFIARDATFAANAMTIIGIWAGDTTATSGTWIDWHGVGLTIEGGTASRCDKFVDANDSGPRGISAHGVYLAAGASQITTGFRINGGRFHHIVCAYHDTGVVTPVSLTAMPVASFIMGRNGLMTHFYMEDTAVIPGPAVGSSVLGARDAGAGSQQLNWKGDNNVIKTVATE